MQSLTQRQPDSSLRTPFIVVCIFGYVLFLALLVYIFAQYPDSRLSTSTGPKANIPAWFGAGGAEVAYLALGLLIAGLYVSVCVLGTSTAGVWSRGALLGGALGVGWLVFGVAAALIPMGILGAVPYGALIIVPLAAGAWGTSETGRFGSGALAGFWCGVAAAVFIAVSTVAIDVVFVSHFLQTSWLTDPVCNIHRGNALAACEIGDDLGFAATITVGLPLIMAGLGAVGGAIGLALQPQQGKNVQPRAASAARSRVPLIFSLAMALVLVAELVFNLW